MPSIKFAVVSLFAVLMVACGDDVDPSHVSPAAPVVDDGLPHPDGTCFALSRDVYPTSYTWCAQQYGEAFGVPFACDETPPEDSCAPAYDGTTYPDRFCCCDPSKVSACTFYK
jgi:hypothetical protein